MNLSTVDKAAFTLWLYVYMEWVWNVDDYIVLGVFLDRRLPKPITSGLSVSYTLNKTYDFRFDLLTGVCLYFME